MTSQNYKHLTLSDRSDIHLGLEQDQTFKAIAHEIQKDPTTVAKEIKRHKLVRDATKDYPVCPLLDKAPYVCYACPKKRMNCGYKKIFYYAKRAQNDYERLLSEAREGTPLNQEDFWKMDKLITDGIKKGQRIYHIMATHDLEVSKSSVYRYLKRGYLTVSPIDFPRVVKFKKRKTASLPQSLKRIKKGDAMKTSCLT